MKKTVAIKQNKIFKSLYYKGGSAVSKTVVVYFRKNGQKINRLGLTVSKKVGNAVVRNRVRRLMKENYRLMEDKIAGGVDIVFVARSRAATASYKEIGGDMNYLLRKNNLKK